MKHRKLHFPYWWIIFNCSSALELRLSLSFIREHVKLSMNSCRLNDGERCFGDYGAWYLLMVNCVELALNRVLNSNLYYANWIRIVRKIKIGNSETLSLVPTHQNVSGLAELVYRSLCNGKQISHMGSHAWLTTPISCLRVDWYLFSPLKMCKKCKHDKILRQANDLNVIILNNCFTLTELLRKSGY